METLKAKLEREQREYEDNVAWLIGLPEEKFGAQVDGDIRSVIDDAVAKALRDPRLLTRWASALEATAISINAQLDTKEGDSGIGLEAWRKRAVSMLSRVAIRQQEAHRLGAEQKRAKRSQRGAAGEAAVRRLINAHEDEYLRLLIEEYDRADIPLPTSLQDHAVRLGLDARPQPPS